MYGLFSPGSNPRTTLKKEFIWKQFHENDPHHLYPFNVLSEDLLYAIKSDVVINQMKALALIGKVVTTPYLRLMYKNEEKLTNLQMVSIILFENSN